MNESIAVGSWHKWIDLRNDMFRCIDGGSGDIHRGAKGYEAMRVRLRYLHQRDIEGHDTGAK